ncbi:hypothetical protein G9A89_000319 [Geosiphon pyriformis]|nr:hypothetical protein G9A89_000319 [Geosiphon pyriformis]
METNESPSRQQLFGPLFSDYILGTGCREVALVDNTFAAIPIKASYINKVAQQAPTLPFFIATSKPYLHLPSSVDLEQHFWQHLAKLFLERQYFPGLQLAASCMDTSLLARLHVPESTSGTRPVGAKIFMYLSLLHSLKQPASQTQWTQPDFSVHHPHDPWNKMESRIRVL